MKYRITVTVMSCILLAILQSGCKKYLDEKSDSSLIIPSTVENLQALLDDATIMNYGTAAFGAASADDYFLEDDMYLSKNAFQQHVYTWQPYEYRFLNDWSLAYSAIYNANMCLERIDGIQPTAAQQVQWSTIKGSALFYRAYYFLELSWLFSKAYDETTAATDKGIVLRTGTDFNEAAVRSSVKTCYDKILEDAKEAVQYLPVQQNNTTRPSRCAAYGLLARTYLSMRQYDSAGHYANLALQLQDGLMDYNDPSVVDLNAFFPFKRKNVETIFYSSMNYFSMQLYHSLFGGARVDTTLYQLYDNDDLRKQAYFNAAGNYQQFKGNYAADYGLFSGIAVDELLLTRAECAAHDGDIDLALTDINRLLINRYVTGTFVPVIAATRQELLPVILQERRKELLNRGSLRWMDIKRLNKEGGGITLKRRAGRTEYSLLTGDPYYALPIPTDVIETSGIEQN